MNSFKKYPKLNILFISRILIVLCYLLFCYYLKVSISECFDLIENSSLKHYQSKINLLTNYLILGTLFFTGIYNYLSYLLRKKNKFLDKIDSISIEKES